ncbi:sigma 54-interacting transcriptional regulator [Lachnospiraceae bacterium NSJ-143]|nr:sigma 54-interacting transcriptional regulator [Lachnospiraceae bacterium NSJ-143]
MDTDHKPVDELEIFKKILNRTDEGVNVVDKNGVLIYVNRVSAEYCNSRPAEMVGRQIEDFYPNAVLLNVIRTKKAVLGEKIHFVGKKKYVCSSFPIEFGGKFYGAYSVFRDVQEIEDLNRRVRYLEMQVSLTKPEKDMDSVVNYGGTLNEVFNKAKRAVGSIGGPRHSIITGESGTGKTMLANLMYNYAKKIGVIAENAPFIEINCAQFTNPDIAAMEIFGSEEGAYTGSKKKQGLFEQAHGGILFLDEAHTLENYQNLLLKAIESGKIRRIGGGKDISINVIIIAASTRDLKDVLLPELYQRLAQYEMYLPSLRERSREEKELLFSHFVKKYEQAVMEAHNISYHVKFTPEAREMLLRAVYPRNVRQFRDVINYSIDSSSPLIEDIAGQNEIVNTVTAKDIPFDIAEIEIPDEIKTKKESQPKEEKITPAVEKLIDKMINEGKGPRKISNELKSMGYPIEYYKVAYYIKINKK